MVQNQLVENPWDCKTNSTKSTSNIYTTHGAPIHDKYFLPLRQVVEPLHRFYFE